MNHIPLQKLPITVGKMAGAVDLVLNDQSVSRLHARISRDGNRFFITDLNSTNGTFRNGRRLEPNASEIIEPGDEIGIGKLKFIYRWKRTLKEMLNKAATETLFPDISINLLKLPSSQGIVGEKSFVASR